MYRATGLKLIGMLALGWPLLTKGHCGKPRKRPTGMETQCVVEAASHVSVGEQIPHNWCPDKWLSIQIKMNLYFTPHTEISSRWIKD